MRMLMGFLFMAMTFSFGCGRETVVEKEIPVTQGDPVVTGPVTPGPGVKIQYAQMNGYLNKYCVQCHGSAPWMKSEAELRRHVRVREELVGKRMPTVNANIGLPEGDRILMINFF